MAAFETGKRRAGVVGESRKCQQGEASKRAARNRSRHVLSII